MDIRLKRYKKDFNYSYTIGVFPTLELLIHRPEEVIGLVGHPKGMENSGMLKILTESRKLKIPFENQEKAFVRVGARENDYALGVFRKFDNFLDPNRDHIILVNPGGMGNLGTIIRTMLGFGFLDLAIIQPAADIFHPEVIRASMGGIFQIRFSLFQDLQAYLDAYPRNLYAMLTDGESTLQDVHFDPPFGLIFGNESTGLTSDYHKIGIGVRIPQSDRIDSLNLAVSVGVSLYHANIKK